MDILTESNAHEFAAIWIRESKSMSRAAFMIRLAMESQMSISQSFLIAGFPNERHRAHGRAEILKSYLQVLLYKLGSDESIFLQCR